MTIRATGQWHSKDCLGCKQFNLQHAAFHRVNIGDHQAFSTPATVNSAATSITTASTQGIVKGLAIVIPTIHLTSVQILAVVGKVDFQTAQPSGDRAEGGGVVGAEENVQSGHQVVHLSIEWLP